MGAVDPARLAADCYVACHGFAVLFAFRLAHRTRALATKDGWMMYVIERITLQLRFTLTFFSTQAHPCITPLFGTCNPFVCCVRFSPRNSHPRPCCGQPS